MSTRKVTEERARQIILSQCRQYIEDSPAIESGVEEDARFEHLAKFLAAETGADIGNALRELDEVLTTLAELESVDAGTHQDIELNGSGTVDNREDIRDRLTNVQLRDEMYMLLQQSAFRALNPQGKLAA